MDRGERFVFIDARTPADWNESGNGLPGAIRVEVSEVDQYLKSIPQGRTIVAYCCCPNEESSTRVALELMRRGFLNVYPLIGGVDAWRKAGGAVEVK